MLASVAVIVASAVCVSTVLIALKLVPSKLPCSVIVPPTVPLIFVTATQIVVEVAGALLIRGVVR